MQRLTIPSGIRSPWLWLGLGLAAVLIRGLFLDVMDVDASQYASISMEMLQNGSWLQVQHRGADYLDKPPLLFWLSTASFTLFGISNWAYKLPSLLAALAGMYGVYRFSLLFYSPKMARQSAFMLVSSLGLIVICNDVRTDTILLGTTACATWQLAEYLKAPRWRYLIGGFFFIGLAMLAKGPIGLVATGFGVGTYLLLSGQWRAIFRWQWLVGLLVTALVLAPMCWGLWQQFDLHPEKTVNGRTGVSGLYFFFWEQSFGRVTGENVWRNDASAFYFFHVYLWAFLPWCLLLPAALWRSIAATFRKLPVAPGFETYSLGAFVLTFIALSTSQYKLPHYIFITLPWAAVLLGRHLNPADGTAAVKRWQYIALYFTTFIGLLIAFILPSFVFPTTNILLWAIMLTGTGALIYRIARNPFPADSDLLVQRGVWAALLIGFMVNFYFYPKLLPYQTAKSVAQFVRDSDIPADKMAYLHRGSHALDFYSRRILRDFEAAEILKKETQTSGPYWIHTDDAGKAELDTEGVSYEIVRTFPTYKVAQLKAAFLDPSRRDSVLDMIYLLKIPTAQN